MSQRSLKYALSESIGHKRRWTQMNQTKKSQKGGQNIYGVGHLTCMRTLESANCSGLWVVQRIVVLMMLIVEQHRIMNPLP